MTLDAGTAAALKSLGVAVAPVGGAAFDAATSTITFPITSGYAEIHSDLSHKPGYILGRSTTRAAASRSPPAPPGWS